MRNLHKVWFVIFLLFSVKSYSANPSINTHKRFTFLTSFSVGGEKGRGHGAFDFSINIPKKNERFIYIPYLGLYLQHSRILLKDVVETTNDNDISGGVLGIKLGVMLPTLVLGKRFYFYSNFAIGKVSVQSDPWWGRPEESIGSQKVHQVNLGVRLSVYNYLIGFNFSKSDLAYIGDNKMVFLGVNF